MVLVRGKKMADSFWYIKNCNLFSQLSAADISELESQSRMRKLKRGEAVYLPQDQADGVILVAQGRVKICHATPDGKQSILGFIDSGEIFGELSLLGTERRDEYVETTEGVKAFYREQKVWGLKIPMVGSLFSGKLASK